MTLPKLLALWSLAFVIADMAQAQEPPKSPDCATLSREECSRQLDEFMEKNATWAKQLAASRAVGNGWDAGCAQDRVTLEWQCFAVKHVDSYGGNSLRIAHSKTLGFCFMGVMNDHPGRTAVIRIGSNAPISYQSSLACGSTAKTIIDQLMTEQQGATRGTKWPSKPVEFEFDPVGFPAAYAALKERIANPRP